MYNTICPEKLYNQYSSSLSDLLGFLKSKINPLTGLISIGEIVKHSFLLLPQKQPIPTIKLSTARLGLKFPGIYREEAYYNLKNSKK